MIDRIFSTLRELGSGWRREADERRARTSVDPGADALVSCADDLKKTLRELDQSLETVTAEEYAVVAGVTPQTVRNWIRSGELTAEHTANGYRIPRHAQRRRHHTQEVEARV